ncbi:MAG TPA: alpha/beta-type small acid-soluble spore protein, partial [Chloroflexota bacterium]|nr:alpha/beta-type small acid-soluble spore protein [Chloroflexota bacterium]
RSNTALVRGCESALERLKFEIANEIGVNYEASGGYGGDIPSRLNGAVGGHMVRRMIEQAEQQLAGRAGASSTRF